MSRSATSVARSFLSRASATSLRASLVTRAVLAAPSARAFASSAIRASALEGDETLSSTLAQELKYEQENEGSEPEEFAEVAKWMKSEGWSATEKPGQDEVTFTKNIDNEVIAVTFQVSDLPSPVPEEEIENEEDMMNDEESVTVATVTITKPKVNSQALVFETIISEGDFEIENVSLVQDSKLQTEETAEAEYQKRGLYAGPRYDHLDPNVQDQFVAFLEARGVNEQLADAILEYQKFKEQKEYMSWLEGVKSFVDQ